MDASGELKPTRDNPYVGPRPYTREEEKLFFGRERESRDLLSLVVSERLVLFYAQSGAGKTSLINTRLVPGLEGRGFEVLPVGRVSGELPPGQQVENIYTANLMLKLDMGEDDPSRFTGLHLKEFLLSLAFDGKDFYYRPPTQPSQEEIPPPEDEIEILPRALIIDQFEELFTTHPEAWKLREVFIRQLAEAMQADPYLWVVLAMREDYIAELDPYVYLLPDGLSARYSMKRMGEAAAFEAVTKPVEKLRPFGEQAARRLVRNLSRISAGKDEEGNTRFVEGEFIEPVQLQVVCYQLWEDLKNQPGDQITLEDLQRLARGLNLAEFVNRALADFYQDTLKKALRQPGPRVREGKLREWFSTKLITEASTRGFVYMGEHLTAGIPNPVVLYLEGKLLRGESRAGGRWYELVHDRFIDPILHANLQWTQSRQRKLLVRGGGAVFAVLVISLCLISSFSNFFVRANLQDQATQAYQTLEGTVAVAQRNATSEAAAAQKNATSAAEELETAVARATAANAALDVLKSSKDNLYATQVEAASTLEAAAVESTRLVVEAQLSTLQTSNGSVTASATIEAGSITPTDMVIQATPTLAVQTPEPTRTPDPAKLATEQAATAIALQAQLQDLHATQTAQAQPVRKLDIGYTQNKTPIQVIQIGTGSRNIVLVGGLTGDYALSSSELAKQVRDYFQINIHRIPKGVTLHIVIDANPDSSGEPGTLNARTNPNGVDLNRNWDCRWEKDAAFSTFPVSGGSQPFSELETQALRDYFLDTQPEAVVIWDATYSKYGRISPGGCGDMSLFSEELMALYGQNAEYILGEVASKDTGDAANWLDEQGIPAIRVRLPYRASGDIPREELKQQQDNNIRAVQAIIDNIDKLSQ